jgi:hypothetical protein
MISVLLAQDGRILTDLGLWCQTGCPFQPKCTSPHVAEEYKLQMQETYALLDLTDLHTQLTSLHRQLLQTVSTL